MFFNQIQGKITFPWTNLLYKINNHNFQDDKRNKVRESLDTTQTFSKIYIVPKMCKSLTQLKVKFSHNLNPQYKIYLSKILKFYCTRTRIHAPRAALNKDDLKPGPIRVPSKLNVKITTLS